MGTTGPDNNLDIRRKRLKYLAEHRGIKEADILLGRFVNQNMGTFNQADIDWFEALFQEQDVDIIAWMTNKAPPPPAFDTPMMARMQTLDHMKK